MFVARVAARDLAGLPQLPSCISKWNLSECLLMPRTEIRQKGNTWLVCFDYFEYFPRTRYKCKQVRDKRRNSTRISRLEEYAKFLPEEITLQRCAPDRQRAIHHGIRQKCDPQDSQDICLGIFWYVRKCYHAIEMRQNVVKIHFMATFCTCIALQFNASAPYSYNWKIME